MSPSVLGSVLDNLFKTAHRDGEANGLLNALHGFAEGALNGRLDYAFLKFVGEGSCRQPRGFIERMNAFSAVAAISRAFDVNGAEDGLQCTVLETAP